MNERVMASETVEELKSNLSKPSASVDQTGGASPDSDGSRWITILIHGVSIIPSRRKGNGVDIHTWPC